MKGNAQRNGSKRTSQLNPHSKSPIEGRPQRCQTKAQARLERRLKEYSAGDDKGATKRPGSNNK